MQPVQNGWYCMQCAQYSAERDCCSQDAHDRIFLHSGGSVSDSNLKSLLVSLFAAYEDRPCLGIPYGRSAEWEWLSYSDLKSHVMAYVLSLRCFQDRFLVAAFPENCLALIAFDLAAALLGACSVIAHGETHAHDIVTLLGQENCKIVDKPPPAVQLQTDSLDEYFWNTGDEEVLFSLFATSGSVGNPKLVKRTRSTWFETVRDTVQFSNHLCVTLNFTSLAHSASRTELWWNLACGGQTALANRQLKFLDSLTKLAPTEVAAPPAVWTEIRHDLTSQGILDFKTLKCKMERLLRNLHTVSTGTAPCEPGLFTFLKTIFGGDGDIAVFNHYGATEIGSIAFDGKLNEDLDVKLLEIPEHGIYSPQGELCIRVHSKDSPNGCIFEGYYSEDQCKQAMTEDGYYRTGDIAQRIGHGHGDGKDWEIRIVGRLSNVVKLSDGKFQSLESIDAELLQLLGQRQLQEVQNAEISLVQVCTLEILGSLTAVVYAPQLHKLQRLRLLGVPCLCLEEPLTVENGMLTPSLKLCRHRVLAKYERELRRLIESTPCFHGYPQSTQSNHTNGDFDKVTELLAAIAPGITSSGSLDESRALRDFGVTSIHFARIAAALNIPVHVLAQNSTLRDLKCFTDGLGVKAAEADIQLCIEQWSAIQPRQLPVEPSPCKSAAWKTVVVTGATGNIGSCFVELLQRRGLNVIPVARSLGHDIGQPELGMSKKDYAQSKEADAVIHCAAIVNWNTAYLDLREANVLSALHLARLCVVGRPKQLLFVGSGVAFPEEPPTLDWLQECLNPYMVSKIASEYLIRKLHPQTVVVRAGTVVWHSTSGAHNPSDAYLRLIQSIKGDSLVWQYDDFLDGMNVDAFCRAAYSLFEYGAFGTYNLRGSYDLSRLLPLFEPLPKRVPYAEWYKTIKTLAERSALSNASNIHPLTALFSHIDDQCPPFTVDQSPEVEHCLTKKCAEALGSKLAQTVVEVSGYTAFLEALTHAEKTAKGTELQGERHRRNSKFFSGPLSERIV